MNRLVPFAVVPSGGAFLAAAVVRSVVGDLCASEARGLLRRLAMRLVLSANAKLPPDLRDDLGCEWLAELEAVSQQHGPISAVVWAHGLNRRAAREIGEDRARESRGLGIDWWLWLMPAVPALGVGVLSGQVLGYSFRMSALTELGCGIGAGLVLSTLAWMAAARLRHRGPFFAIVGFELGLCILVGRLSANFLGSYWWTFSVEIAAFAALVGTGRQLVEAMLGLQGIARELS